MNLLYEKTVNRKGEENELIFMSAPAFCYIFPFLKRSFSSSNFRKNEDFMLTGIQIIEEHSKLRSDLHKQFKIDILKGNKNEKRQSLKDVYHPRYLPSEQMFALLIKIIGKVYLGFLNSKIFSICSFLWYISRMRTINSLANLFY